MPFALFSVSFAIAFVAALVLFGMCADGEKKASGPVFKGALTGVAVAAAQFLLLVAGSKGEGALLAPLVGIMLIPAPLFGGIVAGLLYRSRNRSRWIATACMVFGGIQLLTGLLALAFGYIPAGVLLTGAVLLGGGYWFRRKGGTPEVITGPR